MKFYCVFDKFILNETYKNYSNQILSALLLVRLGSRVIFFCFLPRCIQFLVPSIYYFWPKTDNIQVMYMSV